MNDNAELKALHAKSERLLKRIEESAQALIEVQGALSTSYLALKLTRLTERVDGLAGRLEELAGRLNVIESRLESAAKKFYRQQKYIDTLSGKLNKLTEKE